MKFPRDCFKECVKLRSIEIPDSILAIGENAFGECRVLIDVVIPDHLNEIHNGAFNGSEHIVLHVREKSCGEVYAQEKGIHYVLK